MKSDKEEWLDEMGDQLNDKFVATNLLTSDPASVRLSVVWFYSNIPTFEIQVVQYRVQYWMWVADGCTAEGEATWRWRMHSRRLILNQKRTTNTVQ